MRNTTNRKPGYYWVKWSALANAELAAKRPGPLVGEWDGKVWWFNRIEAYQFDCDVNPIGSFMPTAEAA
jgi:hypothetical protein